MNPNAPKPPDDIARATEQTLTPAPGGSAPRRKHAPTLYGIITIKLLKGLLFVALAAGAYTLSDNDLPAEFHHLLHVLRVNPERKFFADLAVQIGKLTEANILWAAAGTLAYSLFSLVEGVGLLFRVPWACWMTIGESAFFVPIEVYELVHRASRERFPWVVFGILVINIVIVWYLLQNRHRLFRHHHHHHDEVP